MQYFFTKSLRRDNWRRLFWQPFPSCSARILTVELYRSSHTYEPGGQESRKGHTCTGNTS